MVEIDESKYPMTEEEFIKRVKELYLEHSTWDEYKTRLHKQ